MILKTLNNKKNISSILPIDYLTNPDKFVYPFQIKEPNKIRTIITYNNIEQFGNNLRKVHEILLDFIKENFAERNEHSFAYHKGVSCLDALKDHLKSNHFIKLDIHHFFESITEESFIKHYGEKFNSNWKNILKYAFYKNALSIGFVTSPLISDFYMSKFDKAIEDFISNNPKLHYSRYSDDMLLSSEEDDNLSLDSLFEFVKNELSKLGLEINNKKTRKVHLSFEKRNSLSFLGLNVSKANEIDNKVTISKKYILFLLSLIEKNERYNSKCRELLAEINSRVAYLAYNSPISFNRFQKKHFNIYGKYYNFKVKQVNSRKVDIKAENIPDYKEYLDRYSFNIHCKVINNYNGKIVVNDGIEIITYFGNEEVVEIPPFVNSIGNDAFSNNKIIKKVILPESVNAVRKNAFMNSSLEEIKLPKSLVYIENNAFCNTELRKINIPVNLKIIPGACFKNTKIEEVLFDDNCIVDKISEEAFAYTKLKEIKLPNSVKSLSRASFQNNKLLKHITFSEQLSIIPHSCFKGAEIIEKIDFPSNIFCIEEDAFKGAFNLKKVKMSENLISLKPSSFSLCPALKEINIDVNNQVYFSQNANIIDKQLKKIIFVNDNVIFDDSIEIIGAGAFANSTFEVLDLSHVKCIEECAFKNSLLLKEIRFGENLISIGKEAFANCISLKSILLPDSVTIIKEEAFANTSLEQLKLPSNLKVLSKKVFYNNNKLERLELPESVEVIEHNAFAKCSSLKELHIGKNVKRISELAFVETQKSLEKITVDINNTRYTDLNSNIIVSRKHNDLILACCNSTIPFGVEKINKYSFAYISNLKKIIIPSSVKIIEKYAFTHNHSLEIVHMENPHTIGNGAFENCYSLRQINLPTSVALIGDKAFNNTSVEEVILPVSVNKIGVFAFANNSNLEKIFIPSHLDTFDRSWFDNCTNIKEIIVDENNIYIDSRDNCNAIIAKNNSLLFACKNTIIPDDVIRIEPLCFVNYKEIEEINLPDSIVELPVGVFSAYQNLKKIKLPTGISEIPDSAFEYCYSLKEIDIPSSVNKIGTNAFYYCVSLKEIVIPENVHTVGASAFNKCVNLNKVIYKANVPNSSYIPNDLKIFSECTVFAKATFKNCYNLNTVEIPNNDLPIVICKSAFESCNSLKALPFDREIIYIEDEAFKNCDSLVFNLSMDVQKIGNMAFSKVVSFRNIVLGDKLSSIDSTSFMGCDLDHISVSRNNIYYSSNNDGLYKVSNEGIKSLIIGTNNTVIDGDTNIINQYAFNNLQSIRTIVIPENVYYILNHAFFSCNNLYLIMINSKDLTIDDNAFNSCLGLEKIQSSSSVTFRPDAFSNCVSLKEIPLFKKGKYFVVFNDTKEIIVDEDVDKVVNLFNSEFNVIKVNKNNKEYSDLNGSNILIDKCGKLLYSVNNPNLKEGIISIETGSINITKNVDEFVIPKGVTMLSHHSIMGTGSINKLLIPDSVNVIAEQFICVDVNSIEVDENNKYYKVINGNLIEKSTNKLILLTKNATAMDNIRFTSNYPYVSKNIKKIYIPYSIYDISGLINVDSFEEIEVSAKHPYLKAEGNCLIDTRTNSLILASKDSKIPSYIKRYNEKCFLYDKELTSIIIGANVSYIHPSWITKFNNIKKVEVDKENKTFYSSVDNKKIILRKNDQVVFTVNDCEFNLIEFLKIRIKLTPKLNTFLLNKSDNKFQVFWDFLF